MVISQINVKILTLTLITLIYSCFCSCDAQTTKKNVKSNSISVQSISSGNSGFRGRMMPEDMGKSNSGSEYIEIEFKARARCTIDSVCLIFKDTKQSVSLQSDSLPKKLQKNENWSMRVDNVSSQFTTESGELKEHAATTVQVYIKGKRETTEISKITRILPK